MVIEERGAWQCLEQVSSLGLIPLLKSVAFNKCLSPNIPRIKISGMNITAQTTILTLIIQAIMISFSIIILMIQLTKGITYRLDDDFSCTL